MITDYYRPKSLEEALLLLSAPNFLPLGGGTLLSHASDDSFAVVDLQALNLNKLRKSGNNLEIGAAVTLQNLLESTHSPTALKTAIKLETPLNLRNMGTVAGTMVTSNGRSSFITVMLALDAKVTICCRSLSKNPSSYEQNILPIGEILPFRKELLRGKLISKILIPLQTKLAFESIARTPADKPIICTAVAHWPSGRTRLVIGGWGNIPTLAMDGLESAGIEAAARNATHDANDEWASANYRSDVAVVLAKRCVAIYRNALLE